MGDADIIELGIIDPAAPRPGSHAATDSRNSGKAPPLKRIFGREAIYAFSCTLLITWEHCLLLFPVGLKNGGPSGLVYGFLFTWLGSLSTFATLSELTSMAPTSGGQYHYVSMLAPRTWEKLMSYFTGWLVLTGWLAYAASAIQLTAAIAQGIVILAAPNSSPQPWHVALLTLAGVLVCAFFNTVLLDLLPIIEPFVLVLHVFGFIAIVAPLIWLGPHASPSEVFANFVNGGEWSSMGLSFFVGLVGNGFTLIGADGAMHLAEEVKNAETNVPRAILISIFLNGILGLIMLLTILFCSGNILANLHSSIGLPFLDIFRVVDKTGTFSAILIASIVMSLSFFASLAILAAASRTILAFSRDLGFPYYNIFCQIHRRRPIYAIVFTAACAYMITLFALHSFITFANAISVSVAALYSSYLCAAALLLWRRTTGAITSIGETRYGDRVNMAGAQLVWGPWNLQGPLGTTNNIITCVFLTVSFVFSFWPSSSHVTVTTFNFSILNYLGILLLGVIYYVGWARFVYKGPSRRG